MANWWGNLSGAQAVEMGMNVFNQAQAMALQKQQEQQQLEQQKQENFFTKMQLDLKKQQLDFTQKAQAAETGLQERSMKLKEAEDQRSQQKQEKIAEYSTKLSDMIGDLDFSSPKDMKKLYALQAQYQPYGVTPKYIEPKIPEDIKPMDQKEYSSLVFQVWDKLRQNALEDYKQAKKDYGKAGFFGLGKGEEPEMMLPDLDQAKEIANQMIKQGLSMEEVIPSSKPTSAIQPQALQPQGPQYRLGTQRMPPSQMNPLEKAKLAIQPFTELFNPNQRRYNALSAADKRVADIYMKTSGADLSTALDMIDQAKRMKAQ
jgi:hypothetical protein